MKGSTRSFALEKALLCSTCHHLLIFGLITMRELALD